MSEYTPEMLQAERELDARIDHALGVAREIEARLDEQEHQEAEREPPSDEDVRRLKTFILSCAHTPEWELVTVRIDDGELTWRQVCESPSTRAADPQITAAFESLSRIPPPPDDKLTEIATAPEQPAQPAMASGRRRIMEWPN